MRKWRPCGWNGIGFTVTGTTPSTRSRHPQTKQSFPDRPLGGLSGSASASFAYDGAHRRRGKTIGGVTTNLLYDGANLVQELSGAGAPTANLLTGLRVDENWARTDASGTSTFVADALGNTVGLTDASG